MEKQIYFDHAATTFVKPEVVDAMLPYFTQEYGNASTVYKLGESSKSALDNARQTVADIIGCLPREIYFTSCGTEADNWALKGVAFANKAKGNHIITSQIEHHAVLHTCKYLEKNGFEVTYLPVDEYGKINIDDLKNAIKDTTILISIMFANNEIGTVQPIKEIGAVARERGIYFHTDAVQAVGAMPINVADMNIDMLSMSAHKFNGPKGVGALYIKGGTRIDNLFHGGGQELKKRAGTENIAGIVGLATALKLANDTLDEKINSLTQKRDYIINTIQNTIPFAKLNGHPTDRLPSNINFSFKFIEGESLLLWLDIAGIAASSGSACTSGSLDPSHVLLAIGLPHEIAHGSLRISLGEENTMEEINYFLEKLPEIVLKLRKMSPLYEGVEGE